ncbi:RNA-binding KH domain-containing protein PEPPER [Ziziphus jujuba]|uniref:RNA-binding KH domain-containing protein PEPPER n=1 Tax=Ziziphus jujuba TaxID=326968 RepID=A0ABM3INK1_ZIZJJ|nr:RNA-binding KH domain-containing protein PEPPER [Ziziphus jujuba]
MATTETVENGSTKTTLSDSQRVASDGAATAVSTSTVAVVDTLINPVTDENQNSVVESDSAPPLESDAQPTTTATTTNSNVTATATTAATADKKWPGWPGDCVFRLIVPVAKVGSIIGRKGELIKKMCEETRARIRVLDGPVGTPDRIVLISGKEEPDAPLSPAMDAVIRIFKRVSGLSEAEGDASLFGTAAAVFCSIRLLVASTQAINLIGKQGSLIKSIQESTAASVRVLSGDEVPFYAASDERIVELQGEASKVLKALEAVIGHLRKFLVDHSVLPLFEKNYNATVTQERQVIVDNTPRADKSLLHTASQTGVGTNYPLSSKRESLYLDREPQLEAQLPSSGISIYGQDPTLSGIRSSGLGRAGAPIVTQITQTMQIPLSYAEDIIGIEGSNIAYIRRTSGAILTVQEIRGVPDEITVEIKGTSSQVQLAQQLIQEVISNHQDPLASTYGRIDAGLRSSYSQLNNSTYPSSSLSSQSYGVYGSSGLGGYSAFRL